MILLKIETFIFKDQCFKVGLGGGLGLHTTMSHTFVPVLAQRLWSRSRVPMRSAPSSGSSLRKKNIAGIREELLIA